MLDVLWERASTAGPAVSNMEVVVEVGKHFGMLEWAGITRNIPRNIRSWVGG